MKKSRQKFARNRTLTGCIYLRGSQYCASEVHLKLRSSLHKAVNNSALSIGKDINKNELYKQLPYRLQSSMLSMASP